MVGIVENGAPVRLISVVSLSHATRNCSYLVSPSSTENRILALVLMAEGRFMRLWLLCIGFVRGFGEEIVSAGMSSVLSVTGQPVALE